MQASGVKCLSRCARNTLSSLSWRLAVEWLKITWMLKLTRLKNTWNRSTFLSKQHWPDRSYRWLSGGWEDRQVGWSPPKKVLELPLLQSKIYHTAHYLVCLGHGTWENFSIPNANWVKSDSPSLPENGSISESLMETFIRFVFMFIPHDSLHNHRRISKLYISWLLSITFKNNSEVFLHLILSLRLLVLRRN